jgi:hypothetical protein
VLHAPRGAVRPAVLAQGRPLAGDAGSERPPHAAHELLHLSGIEVAAGAQWMDARPPECLVGVDVPDAREEALVEQERLDRGAAAGEPLRDGRRRAAAFEKLCADAGLEV